MAYTPITSRANGTYKTSSGQTYSVRSTPESERKYKIPTSLTASQGGGSINYSGGVATSNGKIIGTYTENKPTTVTTTQISTPAQNYTPAPLYSSQPSQPSKKSNDYALAEPISNIMIKNIASKNNAPVTANFMNVQDNKVYTSSFESDKKVTYAFNVEDRNMNKSIGGFKSSRSGFTPDATVSVYKKPSAFQSGAFFVTEAVGGRLGEGKGLVGGLFGDKQTLGSTKDFAGRPSGSQFGAVASLPISAFLSGSEFVSKGVSGVSSGYKTFKTSRDVGVLKLGSFIESSSIARTTFGTYAKIAKTPYVGFGLTTATITGVSMASSQAVYSGAIRLSGTNKETFSEGFRYSLSQSAPSSSFKNDFIYGSPMGTLYGNKEKFSRSNFNYFISKGYNVDDTNKLVAYSNKMRYVTAGTEATTLFGIGGFSEGQGRKAVAKTFSATKNIYSNKLALVQSARLSIIPIGKAGFQEGFSAGLSQDILRGDKPSLTKGLTYGGFGAVSAGALGAIDVGLSTRATVKGGRINKFVAKTYDTGLNILDPTEKGGDMYRDYTEKSIYSVTKYNFRQPAIRTFTPTKTFSFTTTKSNSPTNTFTPTKSKVNNRNFINTFTSTPTSTKTNTNIFTPTPTNTFTPTPTKTSTKTSTNVFTPTPTMTFTPTNIFTPTPTNTNTPVNTPVITNRGFPPIIGWGVGRGRGREGMGVGKRISSYAPSLTAGFFNIKSSGKSTMGALTGFEVRGITNNRKKKRR